MGIGTLGRWGVVVAALALACSAERGEGADEGNSGFPGLDATGGDDGGPGGNVKLDVTAGGTGAAGDEGGENQCEKIDFLFVIDNSGSMEDEQQSLVASFPGFIDTVQQATGAMDFQIMVVDTDTLLQPGGGNSIMCTPDCCATWCPANPGGVCNGTACNPPPMPNGCDDMMGAGKTGDQGGGDCGIDSGSRYMLDNQADLAGTFSCVGLVGTNGDGDEKPMDALRAAIGPENAAGGCNEGFVRDDAVLVVTIITDEEDDDEGATGAACGTFVNTGSAGDPAAWFGDVAAAKGGVESNAVVLALVGPPPPVDAADPAQCPALDKCGNAIDGAEEAPRLVDLTKRFTHHVVGQVCAADYGAFFSEAVGKISTACDEFIPPA